MAGSPFHRGEQALQERAGVRERIERSGHVFIRDHMPEQHRELFDKLPTLLLGAVDRDGQPWATMLHGAPGFVTTPDARTLRIAARPPADDLVAPLLVPGAAVGVLGIEPPTRRRNRANGTVAAVHAGGFDVAVTQSFGNCPKYIQARTPLPQPRAAGPAEESGAWLGTAAAGLLRNADTLFIASSSARDPRHGHASGDGVDVSHRGGRPGFVRIGKTDAGQVLTLPDYSGNHLYNTLGNLLVWPFAGLLFVDYANGDVLQVAARAELQHDGFDAAASPGALRLLHLHVQSSRLRRAALPLVWTVPEFAPELAG